VLCLIAAAPELLIGAGGIVLALGPHLDTVPRLVLGAIGTVLLVVSVLLVRFAIKLIRG
jgi:hypothetical protein